MPPQQRQLALLAYAFAICIAVTAFCTMPWWTVDDAFISYRYGKNLATQGELNWNPGGERVEGYTGIFLPMVSAAWMALGLPMVDLVKVMGIAALLLIALLMGRTLRSLGVGLIERAIALLLFAAAPLGYLHSISGLETIFFTLAITWVFAGLVDHRRLFITGKSVVPLSMGLLLAVACRPEGIALAVIVACAGLLAKKRFEASVFRKFMVAQCGVLAIVAAYWVWRWSYYGHFLPNSFHAKVFEGWINIESGWAIAKFLGYYAALPAIAALMAATPVKALQTLRTAWWFKVGLAFFCCCCLVYVHSNLWMNYGARFMFPFLPLALLALAAATTSESRITRPSKIRSMVGMALIVLQLGVMGFRFHQEWAFLAYYHRIVQDELIPAGKYLKAHLPADATVISFMDAGAIGFYSELKIIDFGRLNDPNLTHGSWDQSAINAYFYQNKADALVMTSTLPDSIAYIDEAMAIVADPRFAEFRRDTVWSNGADYPYFQHLFLRQPVER